MLFVYNKRRWLRLWLWIVACLIALELCFMVSVAITARAMDAPRAADTIIVLGCGIDPNDGTPRATLRFRLERAKELYEAGYAPHIILSGGRGTDEPISEAESMRRYLLSAGLPDSAMCLEDQSRNTRQNLLLSKKIMDTQDFDSALIVTSDYHLWRAMKLAQSVGIDASCAGSKNSDSLYYSLQNLAQETLSWVKFILNM